MAFALGIDTGGTYTDAVLVDQESGAVVAAAKAPTTRGDLAIGIGEAVRSVLRSGKGVSPVDISLVGLSTTLATNAIVEGQGSPVCLVLIGYDRQLIQERGFERELVTRDVVYISGGHDGSGEEITPLDEGAARRAIAQYWERVEAFAVSGYFSVRNPAHELRLRQLLEELTATRPGGPLPVTCGHELSAELDSVRRATTAALNARLIPLLHELVATVAQTLKAVQIDAPLMVVRGDGSLVKAAWAKRRPIETILSGPAASAVGALRLAGRRDGWVVDVGGTTTDIAVLEGGRPRLDPGGAQVGGWRTMVETVDVQTVGLGGDSHVQPSAGLAAGFAIGPRRVVPLCALASEYPKVVDELRRQWSAPVDGDFAGQFVLPVGRTLPVLGERARQFMDQLDSHPHSLVHLADKATYGQLFLAPLETLEAERLVLRAGFTPTDALHVLGGFEHWDGTASRLGAELLAAQLGLEPTTLCQRVVADFADQLTRALVTKVLGDEVGLEQAQLGPLAQALLQRAQGRAPDSDLECRLGLGQPLVAIGAPVEAYLPRSAAQLNAELLIPTHAEVANALGAVAGSVVLRQRAFVRPGPSENSFQLLLPDGVRQVASIEAGIACARALMPDRLRQQSREAGAEQVELSISREDRSAPLGSGEDGEVFVEAELVFTAVGRPALATPS